VAEPSQQNHCVPDHQHMHRLLAEQKAFQEISRAAAAPAPVSEFYPLLHEQIRSVTGAYCFTIALVDRETNTVSIPYHVEQGVPVKLPPFPLSEGAVSALIQSKKSLLLSEYASEKIEMLGGNINGRPAQSWLGVPLLVMGESIGAIVIQDEERQQQFSEDDQRFLSTIAGQAAAYLYAAEQIRHDQSASDYERRLFDIAAQIRQTTDMRKILQITASELGKALRARRATIRIRVDGTGPEFLTSPTPACGGVEEKAV
jgi:GAF domain-containing protein